MADDNNSYELHESVFNGDTRRVSALIRTYDVAKKDKHGNTPLHLAVMLGRKECIHLLLAHGAPVKVKNLNGWSPLAEAISYGDRQTISVLLRKLKQQSREHMEARRPDLVRALSQMGDFYMELKWDFQSWVPLVSRILPSDICKIHKKGASIRLDTTLVDFNDMRWERGDISFLFSGSSKPSHSLTVLDNKLHVYQGVRHEETEGEIEDEVDILMSSDIVAAQMSTKQITFSRAQTGWIFRADKKELVGKFNADFYSLNGLTLESRKRREHLSEEDLQKNKAIVESFTKGGGTDPFDETVRRASLEPPSKEHVSWESYIQADPGHSPSLGRTLICKESSKSFKATVAMYWEAAVSQSYMPLWTHVTEPTETGYLIEHIREKHDMICTGESFLMLSESEEFPLTVEMLLNVLEVIAPFKHFAKLREFVQMKLPPGFPVKIDIPILPTVSAKITFQEFAFREDIPDSHFEVPAGYREDPNRFPEL